MIARIAVTALAALLLTGAPAQAQQARYVTSAYCAPKGKIPTVSHRHCRLRPLPVLPTDPPLTLAEADAYGIAR